MVIRNVNNNLRVVIVAYLNTSGGNRDGVGMNGLQECVYGRPRPCVNDLS